MRIVIAEDSVLLRAGLTRILADAGEEVVATVGAADELMSAVERQYATELLADRAGGVGYLLKDRVGDIPEFMDALRRVARGGTALDPEVVARLMVRQGTDPLAVLTPREREVLAAMAEGRTNVGIAKLLSITEGATEKHITNIFGKLTLPDSPDDHRRVLAVLAYLGS